MKHAGAAALNQLEPLLERLRGVAGLKEKSRGVFYRNGRAFLHFHDDPAGLFADIRLAGSDFTRLHLTDDAATARLLAMAAGDAAGGRP